MFTRRNAIRLLIFAACAAFACGALPESWRPFSVYFLLLSPLLNLCGAVAGRAFGAMALLALPLLILPLLRGRLFCWRICPMGFLAESVSRLNARNAGMVRRVPHAGKGLALLIAASSLAGYPVLIWADPLCLFTGFFSAWRQPFTWAAGATAAGFIAVLLLSLLAPNVWCHRLCPLGGLEEWLSRLADAVRARRNAPAAQPSLAENVRVGRRVFLGFAAGGAAGLAYRKVSGPASRASAVRPPGSSHPNFNALCARCGNCMKACPYALIVPDLGATGVDGLFTPVLKFRSKNSRQENFCFQGCTACTQACPTGAIRLLSEAEKKQIRIGTARIDKKACIAWEKGEYCVVCQEFCPYQAIVEVKQKGVNCPIVDEALCRGCGACESQCPAKPIAIVIEGHMPQLRLAPAASPAPPANRPSLG